MLALLLQIVAENGGTVSVETPILKESVVYSRAARLEEVRLQTDFLWGLTGELELDFSMPFAYRRARATERFGPADAAIRAKYSFLKDDDVMASTRVAGFMGVELPTGDAETGDLPRKLTLGSGSVDPWVGAVFTRIDDRHRFSIDASYKVNGAGLDDAFGVNAAYWYRLHPAAFDPEVETTEVRGVVEILTQENSGWIVRAAPGFQVYPSESVLLEFNVQIPIHQDVDDAIGHRDVTALFAIKFLF